MRRQRILAFLQRWSGLAGLCSQNGWIDNDSLRFDILQEEGDGDLILAVEFEEIIMEGAGCIAGRVPCYGRLRLRLDLEGDDIRAELL